MKKFKKGFTIVELVIVIAVIGILTSILIPVISGLVHGSQKVADNALLISLNKELKSEQALDGDKIQPTMYDALEGLSENGFGITKLNTKFDGNILLWDSRTNIFVIATTENGITTYSDGQQNLTYTDDELIYLWVISSTVSDKYSTYLYNFSGTSVNAIKGLDVGDEVVESINYTSETAQTVIIRTNSASTTLTIDDASTGTIYHYGSAGALNIIQCHTASYHENGKVAYAEIAYGRIVLESGSKVEEIHVNKKTDSSFDTVIIANNGGEEELPQRITRDAVTVSEETLVVKVESNGSSENVYVYVDGASGTKGSTQKITEGENLQNQNVNSALGQLVLDNGATADKAQTAEEKQATKEEVVEEAVVEEIEEDDKYVARIGTTPFESLKDAVASANTNDIIEMTANDVSTETLNVGKHITIKMNEKTFGGTIAITASNNVPVVVVGNANIDAVCRIGSNYFSNLTTQYSGYTVILMKDITMSQIYKQDYSGTAKNWGIDLNGHTITLTNNNSEGGVYVGSYYGTNHTLSFSNGNLVFTGTSSSAVAMEVYGNLNLNNVNVTSSCGTAIKIEAGYWDGPGHVTITGGSIVSQGKGLDLQAYKSGTTVKQSTAVLTNVTISAKNEGVKSNGASCTIESCSISSTNSYAVSTFNSSSGSNPSQVIISGNSSISASSAHAVNCTSGTLQISGNTEVSGTVYVQSSAMIIAGGVYHGNFSLGGSGQLTIAGGTFNGNLINVTQAGRLLVIGETQFEELITYSITGSNGSYEVVAQ